MKVNLKNFMEDGSEREAAAKLAKLIAKLVIACRNKIGEPGAVEVVPGMTWVSLAGSVISTQMAKNLSLTVIDGDEPLTAIERYLIVCVRNAALDALEANENSILNDAVEFDEAAWPSSRDEELRLSVLLGVENCLDACTTEQEASEVSKFIERAVMGKPRYGPDTAPMEDAERQAQARAKKKLRKWLQGLDDCDKDDDT